MNDDYYPSESLTELFLSKMIVRVRYQKTFDKKLNLGGEDIELKNPFFEEAGAHPETCLRLFNFAQELLKIENKDNSLSKLIVQKGTDLGENKHCASLKTIFSLRKFQKKDASDVLVLAVNILFRK